MCLVLRLYGPDVSVGVGTWGPWLCCGCLLLEAVFVPFEHVRLTLLADASLHGMPFPWPTAAGVAARASCLSCHLAAQLYPHLPPAGELPFCLLLHAWWHIRKLSHAPFPTLPPPFQLLCRVAVTPPSSFLPLAGEVPFRSDNGEEDTDAAFLQSLRASLGVGAGEGEQAGAMDDGEADGQREGEAGGCVRAEGLSKLQLAEADVAKVGTRSHCVSGRVRRSLQSGEGPVLMYLWLAAIGGIGGRLGEHLSHGAGGRGLRLAVEGDKLTGYCGVSMGWTGGRMYCIRAWQRGRRGAWRRVEMGRL